MSPSVEMNAHDFLQQQRLYSPQGPLATFTNPRIEEPFAANGGLSIGSPIVGVCPSNVHGQFQTSSANLTFEAGRRWINCELSKFIKNEWKC